MSITNKKVGKLWGKIAVVSFCLFLAIINLQVGINDGSNTDLSIFGLSFNTYIQDALAGDSCTATATDCGEQCSVPATCESSTCYGGGDSAACWCLDYPPSVNVVHCPPGGGGGCGQCDNPNGCPHIQPI